MFEDLNPEQRAAATHGGGPLLIVAGAGTGKTTTLAARVAWLIAERRRPPRADPAPHVQPPGRARDARPSRTDGGRRRHRPGMGRHLPRGGQPAPAAQRAGAGSLARFHGARPGRRRRRHEPPPRRAGVRGPGAPLPAQGDPRRRVLAGGERRGQARSGARTPLPLVRGRSRRHPRDLHRLPRAQAVPAGARLRRPPAVLEGAGSVTADGTTARRELRPCPRR